MIDNQFIAQVGLFIAGVVVLITGVITHNVVSLCFAFVLCISSVIVYGFPRQECRCG
jgi:uncharacterized membrane protein YagU involved in acid resistance